MFKVGSIAVSFEAQTQAFSQALQKAQAELKKTKSDIDNTSKSSESLKSGFTQASSSIKSSLGSISQYVAGNLIAGGLSKGFEFLKEKMFGTSSMIEQTRISLNGITGSVSNAEQVLKTLNIQAAKTPYEFNELAGSAKMLLAFQEPAKKVNDTIAKLGDIAAGTGSRLGEISYIYGQIRSGNVAYTGDLNQLAMRGIPIYDELAKQLRKTPTEIKKIASTGKITFPMIEKAVTNLTKEGGQFYGQMENLSSSLAGRMSTLNDVLSATANKFLGISETGEVQEGIYKRVSDAIKNATDGLVLFADSEAFARIQDATLKMGDVIASVFSLSFIPEEEKSVIKVILSDTLTLLKDIYNTPAIQELVNGFTTLVSIMLTASEDNTLNFLTSVRDTLQFMNDNSGVIQTITTLVLGLALAIGTYHTVVKIAAIATGIWNAALVLTGVLTSVTLSPLQLFALAISGLVGLAYLAHQAYSTNFLGIKDIVDSVVTAIKIMFHILTPLINEHIKAIENFINMLIDAWNWSTKITGMETADKVSIPRFARGVNNFIGGLATINDGGLDEALSLPSSRGGFTTYLPVGTSVINGNQTAMLQDALMNNQQQASSHNYISLKDVSNPIVLEFFRQNIQNFKKLGFVFN